MRYEAGVHPAGFYQQHAVYEIERVQQAAATHQFLDPADVIV